MKKKPARCEKGGEKERVKEAEEKMFEAELMSEPCGTMNIRYGCHRPRIALLRATGVSGPR